MLFNQAVRVFNTEAVLKGDDVAGKPRDVVNETFRVCANVETVSYAMMLLLSLCHRRFTPLVGRRGRGTGTFDLQTQKVLQPTWRYSNDNLVLEMMPLGGHARSQYSVTIDCRKGNNHIVDMEDGSRMLVLDLAEVTPNVYSVEDGLNYQTLLQDRAEFLQIKLLLVIKDGVVTVVGVGTNMADHSEMTLLATEIGNTVRELSMVYEHMYNLANPYCNEGGTA